MRLWQQWTSVGMPGRPAGNRLTLRQSRWPGPLVRWPSVPGRVLRQRRGRGLDQRLDFDLMTAMTSRGVVNNGVDSKGPFKGKGRSGPVAATQVAVRQWQRNAAEQLAAIHRQMRSLAVESRTVDGRPASLVVFSRRCVGAYGRNEGGAGAGAANLIARQLRWRLTVGHHTTWDVVEPALVTMPWVLAQWYRRAWDMATVLNHRERSVRHELGQALLLGQHRWADTGGDSRP